jgi:hypothetical protein
MWKPVAYRPPVRSQLGLAKTEGPRAIKFTNMPLADSPHRSHQGAHLPMEGGGAGWPGGVTCPQRGVVAAGQRALCLAGFRFQLSKS